MGFDITNLDSYVQNSGKEYALKAVASAPTAKALIESGNVQFGVKGTVAILKLNSDVNLVAAGCSRTGGSTVTLSNKNLTVKQISDEANLCPPVLWNRFYADSISKGSSPQEELIPAFAQTIMSDRAAQIAATNEKLIWQGDTSLTGATNMKHIDGVAKQVTYNASSAATGSTIVEKLQNFFLNCDSDVTSQDDFVIAVSTQIYNEYRVAMAGKNIYQPTDDMTVFGTTAKFHVTSGLNGSRKVFGLRWSDLQLGMDGESDADKAEIRYSIETKNWYQDFAYGLGVTVVWPEQAKYATV